MDVKTIGPDVIFRVFTRCKDDPYTFVLDVRNNKAFAKLHIALSYNLRLAANGQTLLDYSRNTYDQAWSKDCWWNKPVIVYGDEKLRKDHPVVAFLAKENRCSSLSIFKEGFEVLQEKLPFICTSSTKANTAKRFPSEIIPGLLYLGDWAHAEAADRLSELNIKRVVTIHNNPENVLLPAKVTQLQFQLADVDTQDASPFFAPTFDLIEEARAAGQAVLVHCGAGVSRSATLVLAYLMRRFTWSAACARKYCFERRSLVNPNDGFWRSLCALEAQLGIADRSNASQGGGRGMDAGVQLAEGAAGEKVTASFLTTKQMVARQAEAEAATQAAADAAERVAERKLREEARTARESKHSGRSERHREEEGSRHRHRERDGGREDDEDRDRRRERGRDSSRRHDRDGHREGERDGERHKRSRDERDDRHRDGSKRSKDAADRRTSPQSDAAIAEHTAAAAALAEPPAGPPAQPPAVAVTESAAEPAAGLEAEVAPREGVVFDVLKDGQSIGHLELGLRVPSQRCLIGRHPDCDVVMEHLSVSRHHAELTLDHAGHMFLTDLGAAHRTNVNDVWIRPNAPRQLEKGSTVRFGASTRQYRVLSLPGGKPV